MEMKEYLGKLLAGLESPESALAHPLYAITAKAWNGAGEKHRSKPGKLTLDGQPDGTANAAQEVRFLDALYQRDAKAGAYTAYYWAQAWGSTRGATAGSTITLFDHNRVETARWVCDQHSPGAYLLVKGAITGIQGYLYDNIKAEQTGEAKRVGRRLRGRSFLVAAIGDLLAERIVEKLGLTQANVLFVGGGHFNLLLPDSVAMERLLEETIHDLDVALLRDFGLKLGIALGTAKMTQADLKDTAPVFMAANDALERAKHRRFGKYVSKVLLDETLSVQNAPKGRTEPTQEERMMESAGGWIPKAAFLLEISGTDLERNSIKLKDNGGIIHLDALGVSLAFIKGEGDAAWGNAKAVIADAINTGATPTKLLRLNSTDFLPPANLWADFANFPVGYGFRMLGQYAPTEKSNTKGESDIMELSDLAALNSPQAEKQDTDEAQKPLRYPRLAAMRLDVDDLGALFAAGLGKTTDLRSTLALSREMQVFFGGYFNKMAERHQIYIVYSGGDDAFVLGSWLNVLEFAQTLYLAFQEFTHGNPHIGFSAGVYLAHPKYPIVKLADDAAEQEKKAKKYPCWRNRQCCDNEPDDEKGGKEKEECKHLKNAICVFDHTLSWERFGEMMRFAESLTAQIEGKKGGSIRRSVLQHILSVIQAAVVGRDDFEFYRQVGRLHGLLNRRGYLKDERASTVVCDLLKDMNDFERFKDYLVPLHYALYKTR